MRCIDYLLHRKKEREPAVPGSPVGGDDDSLHVTADYLLYPKKRKEKKKKACRVPTSCSKRMALKLMKWDRACILMGISLFRLGNEKTKQKKSFQL